MKRLVFLLVTLTLLSTIQLFSQYDEDFICADLTVRRGAIEAQTGGKYKPSSNAPGEYLRVLFVFVQFSGDTENYDNWTYGQLPTYANQLVDSTAASTYRTLTLSDYWKTMARGNFDFIGDVYPNVITLRPESWYISNFKNYEDANKDVLDSLNGKIDFKKYDNWRYDDRLGSFVFTARNADGYLDMMYIIYRNPATDLFKYFGTSFDGIALLGTTFSYTTSDSVIIDGSGFWHKGSGITIRRGADYAEAPVFMSNILSHEYGHYLFGTGHSTMGGIMGDRAITRTISLSGWEMERLGYIAYTTASQNNYTITLQDLITSGQILKIPIGNTNNYYLVENHQRLNKYDQIMRGGEIEGNFDTSTSLGKGIYVWLIRNGNNYPPNVDIKTANGNWNWGLSGTINMPTGWPSVMPLSGRTGVNRDAGKSDRHPYNIYWNNSWWEKYHDTIPLTKQLELTRNIQGLETHPFNYNYNRLLTPWSSPSTYVDSITNIAMQIFSVNGNNITLKVYNTTASCLALPPSKPQNLKVSAVNNFATLTWEPNIEPDIKSGGMYKIYRASTSGSEPTSYNYVTTINAYNGNNAVKTWVDDDPWVGTGGYKLFYKISAVDSSNLESDFSDYDWVAWNQSYQKKGNHTGEKVIDYNLFDNYPNPFNPTTTISYQIPKEGLVTLKIYDILGKEVTTLISEEKQAGKYSIEFNASKLSSGVYLYELRSNEYKSTKKLLLMK